MPAKKPATANPLALAVLALLLERPMHPYEMAEVMRHRHMHGSIKLNYGSLYTVIEALVRDHLIAAQATERAGRRPARTVYALTDAGRRRLYDWLRELVAKPVKEYPRFAAGLRLFGRFPPAEAAALLEERSRYLERSTEQLRALMSDLRRPQGEQPAVPRFGLLQLEYDLAMQEAELAWLRRIVPEIRAGLIPWPQVELREENGGLVWELIALPAADESGQRAEGGDGVR